MRKIKRMLMGLSLAVTIAVVYQWGLLSGQQGSNSGVMAKAFAAENPTKSSPVKALEALYQKNTCCQKAGRVSQRHPDLPGYY